MGTIPMLGGHVDLDPAERTESDRLGVKDARHQAAGDSLAFEITLDQARFGLGGDGATGTQSCPGWGGGSGSSTATR